MPAQSTAFVPPERIESAEHGDRVLVGMERDRHWVEFLNLSQKIMFNCTLTEERIGETLTAEFLARLGGVLKPGYAISDVHKAVLEGIYKHGHHHAESEWSSVALELHKRVEIPDGVKSPY